MSSYIPLKCFSKKEKINKEKFNFGTGQDLAKRNLLKTLLDLKILSIFSKENLFSNDDLSQFHSLLLNEVNESEYYLNKSIAEFVEKFEKDDIQQSLLDYYKENFDLNKFKKEYDNNLKKYNFQLNNFILKHNPTLKEKELRNFSEITKIIEKRLAEKHLQIKQRKLEKQKEEKNITLKNYNDDEEKKYYYDDYKSSNDDSSNSLLLSTVLMSAVG